MYRYSRRKWLQSSAALIVSSYVAGCSGIIAQPSRGMRIVFYTDVHAMMKRGAANAVLLAAQSINELKPDLIIGGGDYIDGGFGGTNASMEPHWELYMSMHSAMNAPIYPAIGNHDLVAVQPKDGSQPNSDPRQMYKQHLGLQKTWYSFDDSGYHFIVLDSMNIIGGDEGYEGRLSGTQTSWLIEDLARTEKSTPIIVTLHMPLLTSLFAVTDGNLKGAPANRVMVDNVEILKLFNEHNLLLVLQGHLHIAEVIRWRNTTFITGGAICGSWWRGPRMGSEEGFYVIDIKDNEVDWQYVDYGWNANNNLES